MATTTIQTSEATAETPKSSPASSPAPSHKEPLQLKGTLDQYDSFDVTPIIGREFPNANLKEWLEAPNSDELLKELAITSQFLRFSQRVPTYPIAETLVMGRSHLRRVSQRGVVFFRKQDGLDNDLQKKLAQRLGELSGKPATSKLHIHPVSNSGRTLGGKDDEISVISSEQAKKLYAERFGSEKRQSNKDGWHSDITFEPVPSDYAILRLTELPKTGGDTLWASGYEVYDRLSPAYQKFLEGLTATYAQPIFNESAEKNGFQLYSAERGAPENVGTDLKAVHPVIRTNPVTGWKSVYAVGHHAKRINEVTKDESDHLLNWFTQLIVENHDLQVRNRWSNPNDLAIWDNRSVYHTATYDYDGPRTGQRAVSLGERPYLDPQSVSRREALAQQTPATS